MAVVTTPQGFIPRRTVAMSSYRPSCWARQAAGAHHRHRPQIEKPRWIPGHHPRCGVRGISGCDPTQASGGPLRAFEEPEIRLKKGLTGGAITGDLRKRLSAFKAFIIAPRRRGAGHRHRVASRRVQDARAAAPNCCCANDELVAAAAPG
jgi:hypothetical protein